MKFLGRQVEGYESHCKVEIRFRYGYISIHALWNSQKVRTFKIVSRIESNRDILLKIG